jgi:undecaprenyl diphosphate synthase
VAFDHGRRELVGPLRPSPAQPDAVNPHTVGRHLPAPEPHPSTMIRPPARRISSFLLWEGEAQLYVTATLWPDFGADELERAITW